MKYKAQRIRDPLHDLIGFKADAFDNLLWDVVQTAPFQRLRRIKQLGFSELVYPGATHSRFAHSVGVFHTARKLMDIIREHLKREERYDGHKAEVALAAALLHDVGHGPFSHSFEDVGKRLKLDLASNHEKVTGLVVRNSEIADVLGKRPGLAEEVSRLIASKGASDIYSAIVSSQFDADRLDYMQRDRLMTGTQHSAIDFTWLISNLEVGQLKEGIDEKIVGERETFVLGSKAFFAAESYVLGLFQLYPTVYFHKGTRSAEKIFTELLVRIVSLLSDGATPSQLGLSKNHPLVKFGRNPNDLSSIVALDDTVIWGALPQLTEAKDTCIRSLSDRIYRRKLFKSEDILGHLTSQEAKVLRKEKNFDFVVAKVEQAVEAWNQKNADGVPRVIIDSAERDPYKELQPDKGPLNQIHIRNKSGLADLRDESKVVSAIEKFYLARAYFCDNDDAAKSFVEKDLIKEAKDAIGQRR